MKTSTNKPIPLQTTQGPAPQEPNFVLPCGSKVHIKNGPPPLPKPVAQKNTHAQAA